MAEATIDNAQHAMTYILLTFLPFICSWFGSLLTTTTIQLYYCHLSNHFHLPLRLFSCKTPQEETLHEVSFAGKACIETQDATCIHPTITRGAPLPTPVGYLSLQSWLSHRAVVFRRHSTTTSSQHTPTNRISVREGVFQPPIDAL